MAQHVTKFGDIVWDDVALHELLKGPTGPVARELGKLGVKITNQIKLNATGPPHGYYKGTHYPSADGRGPGVRTGRLRDSITWRVDPGDELSLYVGTQVKYALYLEFGTSRMPAYPFIWPAIRQVSGV